MARRSVEQADRAIDPEGVVGIKCLLEADQRIEGAFGFLRIHIGSRDRFRAAGNGRRIALRLARGNESQVLCGGAAVLLDHGQRRDGRGVCGGEHDAVAARGELSRYFTGGRLVVWVVVDEIDDVLNRLSRADRDFELIAVLTLDDKIGPARGRMNADSVVKLIERC